MDDAERERRAKNAEKQRRYLERHKDDPEWRARRLAQKRKDYRRKREEDPDYYNRKTLAWQKAHPEKVEEYRQRRLARDPDYERKQQREWREKNRERYREYARRSNASRAAKVKEWHEAHKDSPERKARQIVNQEVRHGRMVKPTRCTDCGEEVTRRQMHAHHEDYSKPLEVIWVCSKCHMRRHPERWAS